MRSPLNWQSKLVLLAVLPAAGVGVVLEGLQYAAFAPGIVFAGCGLAILLGVVTWRLRAATLWGSVAGAVLTANLILSTAQISGSAWHSAIVPVLAVALLAHLATGMGRRRKEQLGIAESRRGRTAAQIAANLGAAVLAATPVAQSSLLDCAGLWHEPSLPLPFFAVALAALAEAAADTVSSEVGQVFGGQPRLLTTLRKVEAGQDGAISGVGTVAGVIAGMIVAALGAWCVAGDVLVFTVASVGGVFGLLFDSLLGATAETWGWLNNDAVNFLSTCAASAFAVALLAVVHLCV